MLLAQLHPVLVQLRSIKCCNMVGLGLRERDSVVPGYPGLVISWSLQCRGNGYWATIQNLHCSVLYNVSHSAKESMAEKVNSTLNRKTEL